MTSSYQISKWRKVYPQCRKTLCGYQIDRCLFTLKSDKKKTKNWAAVLKIVQLYEIIRMYDISRLDSILTLNGTYDFHTFMNIRKNEIYFLNDADN